jgi:glycerol kinase
VTCDAGGRLHVTDVTNASRTQLMNIETLQWDKASPLVSSN